ncbi:hypothetical protein MC885_009665 [Smutsia gigantea]|nr:hypothetical protein MC885_009665 [Smutsia gigantea]
MPGPQCSRGHRGHLPECPLGPQPILCRPPWSSASRIPPSAAAPAPPAWNAGPPLRAGGGNDACGGLRSDSWVAFPAGCRRQTQPTHSNLGEVRAHLLPCKACCLRTSGSLSTDLQPTPPPLPKKTLARTQSLPTHRAPNPSPTQAGQSQRPLLESCSVDQSQASNKARPVCPPAELLVTSLDTTETRLSWHDLQSPGAMHATLEARQLEGLCAMRARLHAWLLGGHLGPSTASASWRAVMEGGDALYYRVVHVDGEAWHILAAKVPKPGAEDPHPWGLEMQALLPPHFNVQGRYGLLPEHGLPQAPWRGPTVLVAEVPERTVTQWLAEEGAKQQPAEFSWAVALLMLQLSTALQRLEGRGAELAELRPENLLLAAPRGCAANGPQRLLLTDFGRVRPSSPGPPGAHAQQTGGLLRVLLRPA